MNYTYRMHDPRIGRFFAVDPLAPKYPHYSPYQFSGNKVIDHVELEGLEEGETGYNQNYFMPLIPTFEYDGTALDIVTAIDNGVINTINATIPGTYNSIVMNTQSANRGTWTRDFSNEISAISNGVSSTYDYFAYTPIEEQLENWWKSLGDPRTLEKITTFGLTIYTGRVVTLPKVIIWGDKLGVKPSSIQVSTMLDAGYPSMGALDDAVGKHVKSFEPISEYDPVVTLYRGTTGSEAGASTLFLTDDAAVAGSYVKNGGQVNQYQMTRFSLKNLESTGELQLKTGIHGSDGNISTEYMFSGKKLVEALNSIGKPIQ